MFCSARSSRDDDAENHETCPEATQNNRRAGYRPHVLRPTEQQSQQAKGCDRNAETDKCLGRNRRGFRSIRYFGRIHVSGN